VTTLRLFFPTRTLLISTMCLMLAGPVAAEGQEGAEAEKERSASTEAPAQTEREARLEESRRDRVARTRALNFRPRVHEKLAEAIEHFALDEYAETERILEKALRRRMNPVEKAAYYRILGYARHAQEDTDGAIEAFHKLVEQRILLLEDENAIRFNIAQLYTSQEKFEEALTALDDWFYWVDEASPHSYYFKALNLYQLERNDDALAAALRAVEKADEAQESWLQLVVALQLEKEDYEAASPVLEELVTRFSKKRYWLQLGLVYAAQDRYDDSLATQQLAYAQGALTEDSELRRLARAYLFNELPDPASQVLAAGLEQEVIGRDAESLELLANSYIAAREYEASMEPLREAAELEETGRLYIRLGQVHIQSEEWAEATSTLEKALEKRELEDPGRAKILIGIAEYNDEHTGRAMSWFDSAREHEAVRAEADQWITHIERERLASGE
jgi:tetratricopeptide (TPR) repeat protein